MQSPQRPRVGDVYISQDRHHPVPVRVYAVGTNHVRVMPIKKVRRTDSGRWVKIHSDRFDTMFKPLKG